MKLTHFTLRFFSLFCFGILGTTNSQAQLDSPYAPTFVVDFVVDCGGDPAINPIGSANELKDKEAMLVAQRLISGNGNGFGTIYFPPGVYEFPTGSGPAQVNSAPAALSHRSSHHLTYQGSSTGVSEIRFRNRNHHGFYFEGCSYIKIENLNLVYENPSHLEGLITSYSTNAIHPVKGIPAPSYTVRLNPEFHQYWNDEYLFSNTDTVRRIEPFDPVTRRRVANTAAMESDYLAPTGQANTVRVFPSVGIDFINGVNANITPMKDWAVITTERKINLTSPSIANKTVEARVIGFNSGFNFIIQNVQIFNSPFYGVFFTHANSVKVDHVSVLPDPSLSTKGPLVSVNRDALRFISLKGANQITNCDIKYCGDDSIAIFTEYHEVKQRDFANNRIFVEHPRFPERPVTLKAGDYLLSYFPYHMSYTGGRRITAVANSNVPGSNGKWLTLSGNPPVVGSYIASWYHQSLGFDISNNHIRGSRARGIFARASRGTIANNNVADCANGGIIVGPDINFFVEGNFVRDVNIDDNIAYNNSYGFQAKQPSSCHLGGLSVSLSHNNSVWPYYLGNYNVNIRNNSMAANQMSGLFLSNLNKATVDGNTFIANQIDSSNLAGTERGIPANSARGMMHLQGGWNIDHGSNIVHLRNNSLPHRTISTANGSNGNPLSRGLNARSGSLADITDVAATSFELEEAWSSPSSAFTTPPPFAITYKPRGRWLAHSEGLVLNCSNWGLWGNHHRWHFYRGCVSSYCSYPSGWMAVSNLNKPIKKLHFHAAANAPAGIHTPWNLRFRLYNNKTYRWTWHSTTINSSSLPYPPNFKKHTIDLPDNIIRVQLLRVGGDYKPPYLYLDDLILEH